MDFFWNFQSYRSGFWRFKFVLRTQSLVVIGVCSSAKHEIFRRRNKARNLRNYFDQPIGKTAIIAGKYFAILALIVLALSIAVFYALLLSPYLLEEHAWDWGIFWGSLTGLFLLAACFAATGLWASTLVDNAFTAFLIALFVGLFQYYGWAQVAALIPDFFWYSQLNYVALQHHYSILGKGVIPFNSVLYFATHTLLFLYLTFYNLQKRTQ